LAFTLDDTIVAIATPPGRGGIGLVRLSGPDAARIAHAIASHAEPFTPRHATLTTIRGAAAAIDEVIVTFFPAPHSYTAEDVVEISAHGSPVLLRQIVTSAMDAGARLAEPGEFTLRAFLRGRLDLVQAEAVRDLVDAVTPLQARAAFDQLEGTLTAAIGRVDARLFDLAARFEASLDFPEEGYHFVERDGAAQEIDAIADALEALLRDAARGRLVREGAQVVIVGPPNAGKSSLFNALAGAGRAIVTAVPGTTRDLLTEVIEIDGVPMTIVDTAGVRETAGDAIEAEGISRAHAARAVAQLVLVVLDRSRWLDADSRRILRETAGDRRVIVANKADLPRAWEADVEAADAALVSAATGEGLDALRHRMIAALDGGNTPRDTPAITNARHSELVARAHAALRRAAAAVRSRTPEEFVLVDLNDARAALEEITGRRSTDDLLAAIFGKFCIGK
jgi:tRNA modification GTPase